MKNVTLSIPNDLLEKSREYATRHGTSLNEYIRELLRRNVRPETEHTIDSLLRHCEDLKIDQSTWKWNRDELYDR